MKVKKANPVIAPVVDVGCMFQTEPLLVVFDKESPPAYPIKGAPFLTQIV